MCKPQLQPSSECMDANHGESADGMCPPRATGRGQCGVKHVEVLGYQMIKNQLLLEDGKLGLERKT